MWTSVSHLVTSTTRQTRGFARSMSLRYGHVPRRVLGAFTDQALFAGSNFVLTVLLARWLPADAFGAFTVAYAWFLLPQNLYDALLVEPVAIFGAGKNAQRFRPYLGLVFRAHVALGLLIGLGLGVCAAGVLLFGSHIVGHALAGAALAAPLLLLRWLTRQPFYVLSIPQWSAVGGLVYLVATAATLWLLRIEDLLTPFSALLTMGAGSLIASLMLVLTRLRPVWRTEDSGLNMAGVASDHWHYGRWAMLDRILVWVPSNLYYLLFPVLISLSASAALRAIVTTALPVYMAITAITGILLPAFVRTFRHHGARELNRQVRLIILVVTGFTGSYLLILVLFGETLIHLLYAGQFDRFVTLPILITLGLAPVLGGVNAVLEAALRASGGVKQTFLAKLMPAVLTVTVGVALVAAFGLLGANLATIMSIGATQIFLMYFYHRLIATDNSQPTVTTTMG